MAPSKKPAPAAKARRTRPVNPRRVKRAARPVVLKKLVERRQAQVPADVSEPPELDASPTLTFDLGRSEPSRFGSIPEGFVPLLGFGVLLLLGAAVLTPRRVPVPKIAMPLYVHRPELVAAGAGVIALALLWLNIAVLF